MKAATAIGDAFLTTAGHIEFSAIDMAKAFATVAGQMGSLNGGALTTAQSLSFMKATADLASGAGISLASATQATANVMQAFQVPVSKAVTVTDALFVASSKTGLGVDQLAAVMDRVRGRLGDTAGSVQQLSGLLVDMTNQGVTGRAAFTALSSGMTNLDKNTVTVNQDFQKQNAAMAQMTPSVRALAQEVLNGS